MTTRISNQKKQECVSYALAHPELALKGLAADMGVGYSLDRWVRQAKRKGVQGADRKLSPVLGSDD